MILVGVPTSLIIVSPILEAVTDDPLAGVAKTPLSKKSVTVKVSPSASPTVILDILRSL